MTHKEIKSSCEILCLTMLHNDSPRASFAFLLLRLSLIFSNLPVLSAQLITAPTGKPRDILNLAPADPPRPKKNNIVLS